MAQDLSLLRENELFAGLTDEELVTVGRTCGEVQSARDGTLFEENDWATELYLIVEGEVLLKKRLPAHGERPAHDTVITTCSRGDAIGWSALAEPHRYSLTGTPRGQCSYIVVDAQGLDQLMAEDSALAAKIMTTLSRIISRRLRGLAESLISERMLVIAQSAR